MNEAIVTKVLREADALLATPKHWTRHVLSDYNYGTKCFCTIGAVYEAAYAAGVEGFRAKDACFSRLASCLPTYNPRFIELTNLSQFNDTPSTTFEDVKELFRKAIEQGESSHV